MSDHTGLFLLAQKIDENCFKTNFRCNNQQKYLREYEGPVLSLVQSIPDQLEQSSCTERQ